MGNDRHENKLNLSAGVASVSVALVLVGLKLWALGSTQALSIAASLADSGLDLMMSLAGLMAILYAARPADEDHAFGHTSVEDLAALAQSVFVLISGVLIGWAAIARLMSDQPRVLAAEGRGIAVMVVSIALTLGLVLWQRRVARKTGSRVVAADSLHYMSDLAPSLGAIAALWMSRNFGIGQVDSVVALAAALMLIFASLRIGKAAWDALMDRRADPALIAAINDLARDWPGVYGFHDLKTRMAGSRVFVNIHIELDGDQSLRDAHAIGAGLRRKILETYPQCDVIIHKDVAHET
ncbi:MAG: cation diffusion facilitator family transporter [Albidovulum sp.]